MSVLHGSDRAASPVVLRPGLVPGGGPTCTKCAGGPSPIQIQPQHAATGLALPLFSNPVPQVVVPGGLVSILAYIGHPGGLQEYEAVKGLIAELSPSYWWVGTTGG